MADMKKLLEQRRVLRNKRPKFRREGYGTRKRISEEWRRPRGRHSKLRHGFAGHMRKVQPGFRTNKLVRGLHHSGLVPVVINSLNHIQLLNKNQHGAVVGRAVGNRKRLLLIEALKKHGITVLNLKEGHEKKIQEAVQQRKHVRESKAAKKTERRSKKQEKKEEKKERSQEEKEAHEKKEKDRVLTKAEK